MKVETISFYNLPAIESLLEPAIAKEVWSDVVTDNRFFVKQVEKRRKLISCHELICRSLPRLDISLRAGMREGFITEDQVSLFYDLLSELLESDNDYQRLILYLPFEYLPDMKKPFSNSALKASAEHFCQAYLKAWKNLFIFYDVRANFVDGDVLEAELRTDDHPRVVKAAHLIPKLIEKGIIDFRSIVTEIESSENQIFKDSIADSFAVLADLGCITKNELGVMESSKDRLVQNMAKLIVLYLEPKIDPVQTTTNPSSLASLKNQLEAELPQIGSQDFGQITIKRKEWLRQKLEWDAISKIGGLISQLIIGNKVSRNEIGFYLTPEASSACQLALIEGIRSAIEKLATINTESAKKQSSEWKKVLTLLWGLDDQKTKEVLQKTFRRLNHLNLIDDHELEQLEVVLPDLVGSFAKNLSLMQKEITEIRVMTDSIKSNPRLLHFIYPVTLVFGSRLKGYGEESADIDIAVFARPGISLDDYPKIQKLLLTTFSHDMFHGEITVFWLEEEGEQLKVRDFEDPVNFWGDSSWAHILFGSAWIGENEEIRKIRNQLFIPYLFDGDKKLRGRVRRNLCLEEMERDYLLYRLLHKGYERFYPPCGGIKTPHADEIDGDSMFYDSGYRQLATRLFLSRVFLPQLSKSNI